MRKHYDFTKGVRGKYYCAEENMTIKIKLSSGKEIELAPNEFKELARAIASEDKKEYVPWPYPVYPLQPTYPWNTPCYSKPWTGSGYGHGGSAGPSYVTTATTGYIRGDSVTAFLTTPVPSVN